MKVYETYFGGKGGDGVYQNIINCIRPHQVFISPFLGHCAVMRFKKPARRSVGIDLDPAVIEVWQNKGIENLELICMDGIVFLESLELEAAEPAVVYCDPPYPKDARKSRHGYQYDMSYRDHERLLRIIKQLPCDVLISTYENDLYAQELADWQVKTFPAKTRNGTATEYLYMNYENTEGLLHDYSFLGQDFTDRQRIKRKIARWVSRLQRLPRPEMNAILTAIYENHPVHGRHSHK